MNIPTIGGARGIFEVLLPGAFLQVNVIVLIALAPFFDKASMVAVEKMCSNAIFLAVFFVAVGYFAGMIINIMRTGTVDYISSIFVKYFLGFVVRYVPRGKVKYEEVVCYSGLRFPYTKWIGHIVENYLPGESCSFFRSTWEGRDSKEYFNYIKAILLLDGGSQMVEILTAENISRYLANIFYSLVLSLFMSVVVFLYKVLLLEEYSFILTAVIMFYAFSIYEILKNFRIVRIKEAMVVFTASYKNKHLFQ
jgi:hypothetical protein